MLTGDIGRMAELARDDRLDDAEPALFHPIKFMLASPAEDAAEIVKRLGAAVWVEDKYDGIRAQLHRDGDDVRLYSRDLHDISGQFPEVVDGGRGAAPGTASSTARSSPGATARSCRSSRSRRGSAGSRRRRRSGPRCRSIYVAFDVLGARRRRRRRAGRAAPPRAARRSGRRRLEALGAAAGRRRRRLRPVAISSASTSVDALEDAFLDARERRNEGLMVKDPTVDLLARPARARLAEDEEGARDDRLRGRRRRGRPRQAPRRPVGLHVRRPRRRRPTSWSRSARPTAA